MTDGVFMCPESESVTTGKILLLLLLLLLLSF